jgi:hypothetical protein
MKCGLKRYKIDFTHLKDKPNNSEMENKFQEMLKQRENMEAKPVTATTVSVTTVVPEAVVPAHMTPWKTPSVQ